MDENKNFEPEELENVVEEEIEESGKKSDFNLAKELFEWLYTIAIALVIAFLIKGFVFDIVKVDGPSMFPTLVDGDRLVVTKLGYKPENGDIIILDSKYKKRHDYYDSIASATGDDVDFLFKLKNYSSLPDELKTTYYVKRVIAKEGQTVDLKDGKVYVDGELLEEKYYDGITKSLDGTVKFPVTVNDDYVFVMGDNRPNSLDSRSISLGQVPEKAVVGKSVFRLWPFSSLGLTK